MNLIKSLKVIKLLLIKNWRIRVHHKTSFGLLFMIPIVFTVLIVVLVSDTRNVQRVKESNITSDELIQKINITNLETVLSQPEELFKTFIYTKVWDYMYLKRWDYNNEPIGIVYSPINSYTKKLMNNFEKLLKTKMSKNNFTIIAAESGEELKQLLVKSVRGKDVIEMFGAVFGIQFEWDNDFVLRDDNEVPKHLRYRLSVRNSYFYNNKYYRNLHNKWEDFTSSNDYVEEGFVSMQALIDLSHIWVITGKEPNYNISIQKMPIPGSARIIKYGDFRWDAISSYFWCVFILMFSMLVMLPVIVKRIVEEKATRITNYLTLLGIGKCENWFSIIIDNFLLIGTQLALIAFILNLNVIEYRYQENGESLLSDSMLYGMSLSLFLVFLVIFIIQSILFACLVSVFFKNPNISVIATIILWILTFIISITYLVAIKGKLHPQLESFGDEWITFLLPNCSLFWFFWIAIGLQRNTIYGSDWAHVWDAGYITDELSLGHVLSTMLISLPLYCLLILYLSSVIPFENTEYKPFYFPLLYIYNKIFNRNIIFKNYENISEEEYKAITINGLNKKYHSILGMKNEKVLKDIDLEVDNNSIAVILGPNGSGKTTLINIITGMVEAEGEVVIRGYDLKRDKQLARDCIGYCPQENVFYKFLTVREHLQMFYELKTILRQRADGMTCDQLITALNLESDKDKEALRLSGGTMRRLVLGMALIGPNNVLLLDEPTASLDPKVRRKVWDLIIENKKRKTVLITSHHLEEANLLSDVIVIIANGRIRFKGSTLEMKKNFNSGYQLRILKNIEMNTESEINKIISKYTSIKNMNKTNLRDTEEELQYELNFESSEKLSEMFNELEKRSEELSITNTSLGMNTLEDSYAKIIQCRDKGINDEFIEMNDTNGLLIEETVDIESEGNAFKLITRQLTAIIVKRLNYLSKHYILFLTLIIIPLFFIFLIFFGIEMSHIVKKISKKSITLKSEEIYGNRMKAFIDSDSQQLSDSYLSTLDDQDIRDVKIQHKDILESLLYYSNISFYKYFHTLLYGMSTNTNNNSLIVWYNYVAYHSLPISLNLMTNTLLRNLTNDNSFDITVINNPLEVDWTGTDYNEKHNYLDSEHLMNFDMHLFVFGFTFTTASYVLLPITELRTKFKLLQLMSGLNPMVYWFSNFLFDITVHGFCSLIYTIFYFILDSSEFFIASQLSFITIYLTLFLYGFSFIPFAYLMSHIFKKPSTGFTFLSLYNIIGGLITLVLILVIQTQGIIKIGSPLRELIGELLLVLCPKTLFLGTINAMHRLLGFNTYCYLRDKYDTNRNYCFDDRERYFEEKMCCENHCNYNSSKSDIFVHENDMPLYAFNNNFRFKNTCYQFENPFSYLIYLYFRFAIHGLIYFVIIFIIESKVFDKLKLKQKINNVFELEEYESEEVKRESEYVSSLVRSGNLDSEAFVVSKLMKQFSKTVKIPNNLSFSVHFEECFCLLGINGSGKTTTFRLITDDLSLSDGNAWLGSNASLLTNKTNFRKRIGYCPQNDALLDRLTGMQTLMFFGRIRGLDTNQSKRFIKNMISKFGLNAMIDKPLYCYSGGNRRKISLAIALMGFPRLVLLDEPTNGVDPESRLKIWQLLRHLLQTNKTSILLSSHNMEECEQLSTRLALMSNGVLKTIGSISDVKKRFANGFSIVLKVKTMNDNFEEIVETLKTRLYESFGQQLILKYENFGVFYYDLNCLTIKLCEIFKRLERLKTECNIEDYYVSNSSLEQAFHTILE